MAHLGVEVLYNRLKTASKTIPAGSKWYHYKNKNLHYAVVNLALQENKEEVVVVYKPLYTDYDILWTRPLSEWIENVKCESVGLDEWAENNSRFMRIE